MSDAAPAAPTRDEISAGIARRAWRDEAFHKAVLADPAKVYEEHFGQPLPPGVTVKVLEDTANTVHFVLPAKPAKVGELSDDELEQVAGGLTPTFIAAAAGAGFVANISAAIVVEKYKTELNTAMNPSNW
jgi:hypothetical protein